MTESQCPPGLLELLGPHPDVTLQFFGDAALSREESLVLGDVAQEADPPAVRQELRPHLDRYDAAVLCCSSSIPRRRPPRENVAAGLWQALELRRAQEVFEGSAEELFAGAAEQAAAGDIDA